jgi:hypothetical protein
VLRYLIAPSLWPRWLVWLMFVATIARAINLVAEWAR